MSSRADVSLWERSLASLDDDVYLDLARNFLGKIPTPFHKPLLTKKLTTLFSNEVFVDRVIAALSPIDRQLLTGAHLLGSPTQDELCVLFADSHAYSLLQQTVVNLEERLLLVPNPDNSRQRHGLIVNPLLTGRMTEEVFSLGLLLDSEQTKETERMRSTGPDRRMLRAVLSLYAHGRIPVGDKGVRIWGSEAVSSIFAGEADETVGTLVLMHRMLVREKIVHEEKRTYRLDARRAERILAAKPKTVQSLMFLTAIEENRTIIANPGGRGSCISFLANLNTLLEAMPVTGYRSCKRVCTIAAFRNHIVIQRFDEMLQVLASIGIGYKKNGRDDAAEVPRLRPKIDSDLTISFTGDIEPAGETDLLHLIALVRKVDTVCSYELNKDSVRGALDAGCSVNDIITYLENLTGPVDTGLKSMLGHWEEEFNAVSIYDGITVKVDDRLARVVDALPALKPHIITKITHGVYLFSRRTELLWRDILLAAGVGALPRSIAGEETDADFAAGEQETDINGEDPDFGRIVSSLPIESPSAFAHPDSDFRAELEQAVQRATTNKQEREDLVARMERKLILLPTQVTAGNGRTMTMRASGFDFQGKLNLCKAAVNSPSDLLELHLVDETGDARILLTEVHELIGGTKDASLRVSVLPEGEEKVIPIEKMFLVRKLRRSIFFQG